MATDPNIPGVDDQSYAQIVMDKLADDFDERDAVSEERRRKQAVDDMVVSYFAKVISDFDGYYRNAQIRLVGICLPLFTGATCLFIVFMGKQYGSYFVLAAWLAPLLIAAVGGMVIPECNIRRAIDFARGNSLLVLSEPVGDFVYSQHVPLELGCMSPPMSRLNHQFTSTLVSGVGSHDLRRAIADYQASPLEAEKIKQLVEEFNPGIIEPFGDILTNYVDWYRQRAIFEIVDLIAAHRGYPDGT